MLDFSSSDFDSFPTFVINPPAMHLEDANGNAESFVYSPISKEVQQFGTFRVRGRKDNWITVAYKSVRNTLLLMAHFIVTTIIGEDNGGEEEEQKRQLLKTDWVKEPK